MGTYRFILAILVLLSHTALYVGGMSQGVVAVISFLLISGYTMQILMDKYYAGTRNIKAFYVDRILRICPQFWFYSIVTLLIFWRVPDHILTHHLSNVTVLKVVNNFLVLPVGYPELFDLGNCFIIPAAWTIGLELTFYLLFPFIYSANKKISLVVVSFGIFFMAYLGIINTALWGYRLLPGVLFVFLIGSILAEKSPSDSKKKQWLIVVIYFIVLILYIILYLVPELQLPHNKEVLVGLIIGIPMLLALKDVKSGKVDAFLGDLSYGIYLNHFIVMYWMNKTPSTWGERIFCVSLSILFAVGSYFLVECPFKRIRIRYRLNALKIREGDYSCPQGKRVF